MMPSYLFVSFIWPSAFCHEWIRVVMSKTFSHFRRNSDVRFLFKRHGVRSVRILSRPFLVCKFQSGRSVALVRPTRGRDSSALVVLLYCHFRYEVIRCIVLSLNGEHPYFILSTFLLWRDVNDLLLRGQVHFGLICSKFCFIVRRGILRTFIERAHGPSDPSASLFVRPLRHPPYNVMVPMQFIRRVRIGVIRPRLFRQRIRNSRNVIMLMILRPRFNNCRRFLPFGATLPSNVSRLFLIRVDHNHVRFPVASLGDVRCRAFHFIFEGLGSTRPSNERRCSVTWSCVFRVLCIFWF